MPPAVQIVSAAPVLTRALAEQARGWSDEEWSLAVTAAIALGRDGFLRALLSPESGTHRATSVPATWALVLDNGPLVVELMRRGADPASGPKGCTAMHTASWMGKIGVVEALLAARAPADISCPENAYTPLHCASIMDQDKVAAALISHGAHVDAMTGDQYTPLSLAAERGATHSMEVLLAHGAEVNGAGASVTPLHLAAQYGHTRAVELLKEHGADPGKRTPYGYTPFAYAPSSRDAGLVWSLWESIARRPEATDQLSFAAVTAGGVGWREMYDALLAKAGQAAYADVVGARFLQAAANAGWVDAVRNLLQRGASMVAPRNTPSALFVAARKGYVDVVRELLAAGADPNGPEPGGTTPLWGAIKNGSQETVNVLLSRGANANTTPLNAAPPLLMAVQQKQYETVASLLQHDADLHGRDPDGKDAYALADGDEKMLSVLRRFEKGVAVVGESPGRKQ